MWQIASRRPDVVCCLLAVSQLSSDRPPVQTSSQCRHEKIRTVQNMIIRDYGDIEIAIKASKWEMSFQRVIPFIGLNWFLIWVTGKRYKCEKILSLNNEVSFWSEFTNLSWLSLINSTCKNSPSNALWLPHYQNKKNPIDHLLATENFVVFCKNQILFTAWCQLSCLGGLIEGMSTSILLGEKQLEFQVSSERDFTVSRCW